MEEIENNFECTSNASESIDLKADISSAIVDLYYLSESDEPFEYVEFDLSTETPLMVGDVLVVLQKNETEVTEELSFEDFIDPLCEVLDWYGDDEKMMATRFLNLKNYLLAHLSDIQVFRIGECRVEIYAVGKTTDCTKWVGVKTVSVET